MIFLHGLLHLLSGTFCMGLRGAFIIYIWQIWLNKPKRIPKCVQTNLDLWAFHPISVTWFLVVFGNKVTKILCNSLFFYWERQDRQKQKMWKWKSRNLILVALTKNDITRLDFLKPLKIWCHLDNFHFHCFMWGTKGKNLKTPKGVKCLASISENPVPLYELF